MVRHLWSRRRLSGVDAWCCPCGAQRFRAPDGRGGWRNYLYIPAGGGRLTRKPPKTCDRQMQLFEQVKQEK